MINARCGCALTVVEKPRFFEEFETTIVTIAPVSALVAGFAIKILACEGESCDYLKKKRK
ncbi:hypothetical protein [Pseudorhodobacter aquimaris]|uniref:hypothetical protein n=1 Tax=Pseudorhodobacter aquimaris TaxID=687412 RepID=UPI00067D1884|nr:hypothetical protein [Pseudorhodobacter aquimaris]